MANISKPCICGKPWVFHYQRGILVRIVCTAGHDPSESLLRNDFNPEYTIISRDLERCLPKTEE